MVADYINQDVPWEPALWSWPVPFWEVIVKQPTIDAAGPDAMSEDLGGLTGAIGAAGIDTSGVAFVCSPREAAIIKTKVGPKFDYPVLSTLGLLAKTIRTHHRSRPARQRPFTLKISARWTLLVLMVR